MLLPVKTVFPKFTGPSRLAVANDTLVAVRWDAKRSYSTFTILDFETAEVVRTWKSPLRVDVMQVTPDGTTVVCGGSAGESPRGVFAYSLTTGKRLWFVSDKSVPGAADISISPDGKSFVASNWQDPIHVRSLATGTPQRTFSLYNLKAMAAAWSPDGRFLATAGAGSSPIILWDLETGRQIALLFGHQFGRVYRMRFADSKTLVTCGGQLKEGEVCIWNLPAAPAP